MRAIVTAVLVLMSVAGSVFSPVWTWAASAEEDEGGPGMMGYRMTPDTMRGIHEMMRSMGLVESGFHARKGYERPLISLMLMSKEQLGLTADQERSLRELRANFQKESIKQTAEIDVAELELNGLLEQEKVDVAKVEALAKKIAMLQADLRVDRVKTIEAGKAVLTPEQRGKLERLGYKSMIGPGMPTMHPGAR
ncbi:MAG: Spy/CpxP family protein refolding chaperone [Candidatus Methylomirabilis oxyfera]|nr:Spy/CpxP family protein refolding chaperone [Candidatus Methylomirabilis oxyfera]